MSSEPQEDSDTEQRSAAEGTIVQNQNEELCGQNRLLDSSWNPQHQLHLTVLPQHWLTEEDLCNQQRNFRVDQENPEPPQTPEELQDPEPSPMKEEPEELCISQDEEQLDLKQETETWMEIPTLEEHVDSEADGNNQQISVQYWVIEEEDLWNQQKNFREDQNDPEPTQIKEEQEEPEPPQIKEEQEGFCISQDEEQLDLKQETETWMEIPIYEEHFDSESDENSQQSLNITDSQDEEGNQHEESTSTSDEETEPQNRGRRKRRDRSHVQSVASSHMSEGSGKRTRIPYDVSVHMRPKSDEQPYVCKECDRSFSHASYLKVH
ncbi:hypothetical protein OJAV_G00235330, partial [Oryzias javanicus]